MGFDESLQGMMRNPEGLSYFGLVLAVVAAAWFVLSGVALQSAMHASAPSLGEALAGSISRYDYESPVALAMTPQ